MIRIAIADDHPLILKSIEHLFSDEDDIIVTKLAINYSQVKDLYLLNNWDVLVLDIMIPEKNGFEIFNELKQRVPTAKVLFLSNLNDDEIIFKAEILGADGFVHKSDAPKELVKAIRCIEKGEKYFNRVH